MLMVELAYAHEDRDGQPISTEEIEEVEKLALEAFAFYFGGGQSYPHKGSYLNDAGQVMHSSSTAIKAYARNVEEVLSQLIKLANDICMKLNQESVLLSWWGSEESNILMINPQKYQQAS